LDETVKIKIRHEISRIEQLLIDAKPLIDLCQIKEPDFVEKTAMAHILHSFYNGVESVIVLILKNIDEQLPNDYKWHKTLFNIAFGQNSRGFRIFQDDIKDLLENYLSFRHFIRHSYSSELRWNEMKLLVENLEKLWKIIKFDFEIFISN
jgi:hypothetical protein